MPKGEKTLKPKRKLEINKFYLFYSGGQHPALIFEYDDKHKTYKSIKFGTTQRRHMTEIHSLIGDKNKQFVCNRPFEGVRSDYGDYELESFRIDPLDEQTIEEIKKKEPHKTKKARSRYKK